MQPGDSSTLAQSKSDIPYGIVPAPAGVALGVLLEAKTFQEYSFATNDNEF